MISKPTLDLLIIDIDNTFIPHRTVDAGYRLFLKSLSQLFGKHLKNEAYYTSRRAWFGAFKIITKEFLHMKPTRAVMSRIAKLAAAGLHLNALYVLRECNNRFIRRFGSEQMIGAWVELVLNSSVKKDELYPGKNLIRRNLNQRMLALYEEIRKENPGMKVVAITQNFVIGKDPMKELLNIDEIHANTFLYNTRGLITGYRARVRNGPDKRRIAERLVKKYTAKKIGVVVDDYDDLELLELENIELVICSRKNQRFIRNKSVEKICME